MPSRAGSEGEGGRDRDSDEETATHSLSDFLGDKWFYQERISRKGREKGAGGGQNSDEKTTRRCREQ